MLDCGRRTNGAKPNHRRMFTSADSLSPLSPRRADKRTCSTAIWVTSGSPMLGGFRSESLSFSFSLSVSLRVLTHIRSRTGRTSRRSSGSSRTGRSCRTGGRGGRTAGSCRPDWTCCLEQGRTEPSDGAEREAEPHFRGAAVTLPFLSWILAQSLQYEGNTTKFTLQLSMCRATIYPKLYFDM